MSAGPWIPWAGGDCPVSEHLLVHFKLREDSDHSVHSSPAGRLKWSHWGSRGDIVAYRLAEVPSKEEKPAGALSVQVGGDHYKKHGIQPIEYIHANGIGFMEGNVIKYVSRWKDKGGLDDLKKARHYIDLLIELEQSK